MYTPTDFPQSYRPVVRYFLWSTGRASLTEEEADHLRELLRSHPPYTILLEIDQAVDRFRNPRRVWTDETGAKRRDPRPLDTLTFRYIRESMAHWRKGGRNRGRSTSRQSFREGAEDLFA